MAELADAPDSKSGGSDIVWVRVPPSALIKVMYEDLSSYMTFCFLYAEIRVKTHYLYYRKEGRLAMNIKMIRKNPWHLWIIALFLLLMYSMGIYDLFMMLGHNEDYYLSHGYDIQVIKYFTDYPIYFGALWVTNLICGFIAPILLIIRIKSAKIFAFISAISDLLLIILTSIFRNRLQVLGAKVAYFDVFILLITIGLYIYCKFFKDYIGKTEK